MPTIQKIEELENKRLERMKNQHIMNHKQDNTTITNNDDDEVELDYRGRKKYKRVLRR